MHSSSRYISLLVFVSLLPIYMAAQTDSISTILEEIHVKAVPPTFIRIENGRTYWTMSSLETMPHFFGSADPIRMLQLMPGVATNNDYATGLSIQGCQPSHNLLNYDGIPIYNASHLFGLFSTFTTSHFRGMSLVTSHHSASFANRLGGLVTFHPIDSLSKKIHLNATFSFMESEGTLALPVGKMSTLYLSARGSYLNLLYKPLLKTDDSSIEYALQDYNLSYIIHPSSRDRVRINVYHGKDRVLLKEDYGESDIHVKWTNTGSNFKWEHYNNGVIWNQNAFITHYHNDLYLKMNATHQKGNSSLTHAGYESSIKGGKKYLEWESGLSYNLYKTSPLQFDIKGSHIHQSTPNYDCKGNEVSAFADIEFFPLEKLSVHTGFRATMYNNLKNYWGADPRVTLRWVPQKQHHISFHYGHYHQYIHHINISNFGLPLDYYTLANDRLKPGRSHTASVAWQYETSERTYETNIEIYYKKLYHQTEYFGALLDIISSPYDMYNTFIHGKGRNYGINVMVKRNKGTVTGWISYALSRSERLFPTLNKEQWFSSSQERLHDLSAVANYKPNKHITLSGAFIYATGTPFTKVNRLYIVNNNIVYEYGKYNGNRLAPTHRLDVSATWHLKEKNNISQSMNFSIYNVYAHKNRLFQYMRFHKGEFKVKNVRSICRALPSIGYTLKF